MEKKLLPYLVVISALSVSLSAAFYSVTGLGKMFSGASVQVMIMMSSLEIAKLVLASLLYQYWSKLNRALKTYYFIALFVLMSITSAGIYGYLSSAYSDTLNKVENIDKQVKVLDTKREMFQTQLNDARSEKERINQNIAELTKGVSNNFVQSKDRNGNIITTSSTANRKVYEEQLKSSQKRRDDILLIETSLNDSITKIDLKKLDLETNTDIAGEIGPLKYIAKLTSKSMDEVINWFIIALMLVFDPLAVSLVVGANVIFRDKNKEKEKLKLSQEIDQKIIEFDERKKEIEKINSDLDNREKNVSNREIELDSLSKEREDLFNGKIKELEDEYEEKENSLELEYQKSKESLNERSIQLDDLQVEMDNKIESLMKDFKIKQESFDSFVKDEKDKLEIEEKKLKELKKDLDNKEKSIDSIIDDKLEKAKVKFEDKVQSLNKEKQLIEDLKKQIKKEKKEIDSERSSIDKMKDQLIQKESEVNESLEDLRRLDSEIKSWEDAHWQLKRNKGYAGPPPPPPSAIL
jgi:chromosome segregation ATPase